MKFFSNSSIKDFTVSNHGWSRLSNERLNMVWSAIQQIIRPNHSGSVDRRSTVSGLFQIFRVQPI